MKNTIKFAGIIAFVVVIGFSIAACGGDDDGEGETKSFQATADASGELNIQHSGGVDADGISFSVTTSAGTPNSFTLTTTGDSKKVTGLTAGQKVTVTVTSSSGMFNLDDYGIPGYVYITVY